MSEAALLRRFGLAGRRALVTGSSVSLGRAIALGLAEAGADVAIQGDRAADAAFGLPEAAAQAQAQITALGRRSLAIAADFRTAGEAARSVEDAIAGLGGVDILVICASVQSRAELAGVERVEIYRQVAINFAATFELLQAALPGMAERGWGRVLSIGSVNQVRPEPQLGIYAALKAAQHNLIINLAQQYAALGVTLNTLSPGLIATERNRWRRRDEEAWAKMERDANPMSRAGAPEEMVGAALMFCSDAGAFMTGVDLQAAGGGQLGGAGWNR